MPRQVDHDARRAQIAEAALKLLAAEGPSGLTIRALARELRGSTALVMHYFPTREAVMEDLVQRLMDGWKQSVDSIRAKAEPGAKELRSLLEWMLPLSERARFRERARLSLQAASPEDRDVGERLLRAIDKWMRAQLSASLTALVPDEDERGRVVDLLRAMTAGMVLLNAERPSDWSSERQLAVLDALLKRTGLDGAHRGKRSSR